MTHYHVWIVAGQREQMAYRKGRFTTRQAAQKWGTRWGRAYLVGQTM